MIGSQTKPNTQQIVLEMKKSVSGWLPGQKFSSLFLVSTMLD